MISLPLLRNAFLALSLGAFLIPSTFAASAEENGAPVASSTLVLRRDPARVIVTVSRQDFMESAVYTEGHINRIGDSSIHTPVVNPLIPPYISHTTLQRRMDNGCLYIEKQYSTTYINPEFSLPEELWCHVFSFLNMVPIDLARTMARTNIYALYNASCFTPATQITGLGASLHAFNQEAAHLGVNQPFDCSIMRLRTRGAPVNRASALKLRGFTQTLTPAILGRLPNLTTLNLKGFKGDVILDPTICKTMGNLRTLIIEGNAQDLTSETFSGFPSLTTLEMLKNKGSVSAGAFKALENLKTLSLKSNTGYLEEGSFSGLEKLESLDFTKAHVTIFPGLFFEGTSESGEKYTLPNLKILILSQIKGDYVEGTLPKLADKGVDIRGLSSKEGISKKEIEKIEEIKRSRRGTITHVL